MTNRIAMVKTGWCDQYDGTQDPVGEHGYLAGGNVGYERFNFVCFMGRYYAAIPTGEHRVPRPQPREGWTVLFVARCPHGGIRPVGLYRNASFERSWQERPEYAHKMGMRPDSNRNPFKYLAARTALLNSSSRYDFVTTFPASTSDEPTSST